MPRDTMNQESVNSFFFFSLRDVPIASCDDVAADKIDLHNVFEVECYACCDRGIFIRDPV